MQRTFGCMPAACILSQIPHFFVILCVFLVFSACVECFLGNFFCMFLRVSSVFWLFLAVFRHVHYLLRVFQAFSECFCVFTPFLCCFCADFAFFAFFCAFPSKNPLEKSSAWSENKKTVVRLRSSNGYSSAGSAVCSRFRKVLST